MYFLFLFRGIVINYLLRLKIKKFFTTLNLYILIHTFVIVDRFMENIFKFITQNNKVIEGLWRSNNFYLTICILDLRKFK